MLLEELSNEVGVSGNEGAIRKLIIPAIKPHVDQVTVDTMGNIFAYKAAQPSNGSLPTVMVTAHMDEVGFMITEVTKDGMLRFTTVGGFDRRILPGKTVQVGKDKIPGVIGLEAVHKTSGSQRSSAPNLKSLAIDIGAGKKEEAQRKVSAGDYATFDTKFDYLNAPSDDEKAGIVKGKALDNRVGCSMLAELLTRSYPVNVVGVFTVQEEIGLRGARVAAHKVAPDQAIVLECTTADDLPIKDKEIGYPRVGNGPCLTIMDRSFIADQTLLNLAETSAAQAGIPTQYKKPGMGGTDAGAIHLSRAGVPSIAISAPSRYIHSPAALIDLTDFWHCIALVEATLNALAESKN